MPVSHAQYILGNSLVSFAGGSGFSHVPAWMAEFATASGNSYAVSGGFGFLRDFADAPEPPATWGFAGVASSWEPESQGFAEAQLDSLVIAPANFIQGSAPDADYPGDSRSPLDALLDVVADLGSAHPGARLLLYEGWADMAAFADDLPATAAGLEAYHAYNQAEFHAWHESLVAAVNAADPDAELTLVPVGALLSEMLSGPLQDLPPEALYVDTAPHGTETLYFLAAMVTYQASYGTAPVLPESLPAEIHPRVLEEFDGLTGMIAEGLAESLPPQSGEDDAPPAPEEPDSPAEPADPAPPEQPENPSGPEAPTEEPGAPGQPEDPEAPTQPDAPPLPEQPIEPETPDQPSAPQPPAQPSDPEPPTQPTDPEPPTQPSDPEPPTQPSDPEPPTQPTDPEPPAQPSDPEPPIQPSDPEPPTQPTDPEPPTQPTDPDLPQQPTDPLDPGQPDPAPPTQPIDPGTTVFSARYFDLAPGITSLDQVDFSAPPSWQETVETPHLAYSDGTIGGHGSDHIAASYSQSLALAEGGIFALRLQADDHAQLRIDGALVLDSAEAPLETQMRAEVALAPGHHEIELRYLEIEGEATLLYDMTRSADLTEPLSGQDLLLLLSREADDEGFAADYEIQREAEAEEDPALAMG